mmetsp:Transcript_74983/g.219646  ORF Transcript_74983/g.219646 Transcript_74983/m.219646 type:complete len:802 (+) Transcript_74983:76-2481(+)
MLKVWVDGCVDLPTRHFLGTRGCCQSRPRRISVHISEIEETRRRDGESEACLPSTFIIRGGTQDETGAVFFPVETQQRHAELKLTEGWRLRFEILDEHLLRAELPLAFAEIDVLDLARCRSWRLMLSDPVSSEAIYGDDGSAVMEGHETQPRPRRRVRCPAFLLVRTEMRGTLNVPLSCNGNSQAYAANSGIAPSSPERRRRVMMLTRGTRGDVQPFVALARGLILHCNCEVTIVTELCWKSFVKAVRVGLPEQTLFFRPSGGDTMKKISEYLPRLVMRVGQNSDALQALILSRSEVEFFPSEGCMYHWATRGEDGELLPFSARPDFIVFGVTTMHIAMILSETLEIPIVGFILQPRREIEPRADPNTLVHEAFAPLCQVLRGPEFNEALRQVMERVGGRVTLNELRKARGLGPCPRDIYTQSLALEEMVGQRVRMIVPANRLLFRDQAEELESSGFRLTDFIFLRLGTDHLDPAVDGFIEKARAVGRCVVAITFSSMPVGERLLLEIAIEVVTKCLPPADSGHDRHKPACIILAAGQDHEPATPRLLAEAAGLEAEGRLLLWRQPAPFGALFPKIDAVVQHGGLGVTSEATMAGIPTITSGILLLDQLFWAARTHQCGCGSQGVPVSQLLSRTEGGHTVIVDLVRQALDQRTSCSPPEAEASWHDSAKSLQRQLVENRCEDGFADDPDGIRRNALEVYAAGVENAAIVSHAYQETNGCRQTCSRQGFCCVRGLFCTLRWLICIQMWSCIYVFLQCIICCGCRPLRRALSRRCANRQPALPLLADSTLSSLSLDTPASIRA